jgi:hypothetical protein
VGRERGHQRGQARLLPALAGGAVQPVRVGRGVEHDRVARPLREVGFQNTEGDGDGLGHQGAEEADLAGLARGGAGQQGFGLVERGAGPWRVGEHQQHLGARGMRQGEAGVGGHRRVEGRQHAVMQHQQAVEGVDIGVARGNGRGGDGKVVAIRQHEGPSAAQGNGG